MSPPPTSESWKATLDARLAQPRPGFLHSCDDCHEEVPWARCKSNKKGNKGHWYAMCKKVAGEQQTQCTFFRWASGSSGSQMPSESPEIPQESPQLHPIAMPATLSDTTLLFICAALVCGRKPHKLCDNKACRKHCRRPFTAPSPSPTPAPAPEHSSPIALPTTTIPSSPPAPDVSQPPVNKGKARAVEVALPSRIIAGPIAGPSQSKPSKASGPRYATQIPALFTQQNAIEESIQEEERQRDRERLQAAQRAKNNIIIYAWIKDGTEPIIYEFQEGFTFPNFFFSHDMLRKLEILSEDTVQVPPVQRYNRVLDTWMRFDVGHMVTLHDRDGGALLVKNACVKDCIDLGRHIQKLTHPSSPNIVKALPAKRKYMRAASHVKSSCPPSPSITHNNVGPVPTIRDSQHSPHEPSWSLSAIDDDSDNDVGPVPTIHHSQQNRGGSVLSLTDSEGARTKAQLNRSASILSLTDSEEVTTATARPLKQHASPSDSLSPRPLLRLRRHPSAELFQFSSNSETSTQSRSSSPVSIRFAGPIIKEESSGSLLSRGTSKADAIEVEKVAIWPVDFYVIDIANGFNLCKKAADSRRKVSQVFINHFGVPFKASTYYDNRKVWDLEVNRALRERFTNYGRTEKGRWTAFMKKAQRPAK
ncbi:hypothetical protein DEU56DRAFT_916320 [Suillus clintonianus]|uniref:uncharacterized protein n=1 Tax=Suillus clintonianus TaxID=1904413 RepID=UPI001B85F0D7|nr:uncharacterized protein DEU56DRAFT_916320 [Suillus clintonianus]KAG2125819.1 hypothetical protein DEU56DRAFT_916320 [Suillus clintonianus]